MSDRFQIKGAQIPPPAVPGVDEAQAAYWNGALTRAEAQKVFDDYTRATVAMQERMMKMEFVTGLVCERLGIQPVDVEEFAKRKLQEFAARQAKGQGPN